MAQPVWYTDTENWLLEHGKFPIVAGLVVLIAVSAFFLLMVLSEDKYAVPAAIWVTYMFMP